MTLIGCGSCNDAAEARSEQSFIGGSLAKCHTRKDRPTGFQFGYKLGNSTKTELRHDFTVKADGLRPAVQIEKGTVGAEVFSIFPKTVISKFRCLRRRVFMLQEPLHSPPQSQCSYVF